MHSITRDTPVGSRNSESAGTPTDRVRTATGGTFNLLVLEGIGPIVVEFMSYGCSHCQRIEPVLQRVAEMLKTKEKIFRVNVAVERGLADAYAIRGTPTLVMFLNGEEIGRVDGLSPTFPSVLGAVTEPFRFMQHDA
jgi:thioredoxin 1